MGSPINRRLLNQHLHLKINKAKLTKYLLPGGHRQRWTRLIFVLHRKLSNFSWVSYLSPILPSELC